jgi:hypothetical protein
MVRDGVISTEVLNEALQLQQTLQCSMSSLLEREGLLAPAGEKVLEAYAI